MLIHFYKFNTIRYLCFDFFNKIIIFSWYFKKNINFLLNKKLIIRYNSFGFNIKFLFFTNNRLNIFNKYLLVFNSNNFFIKKNFFLFINFFLFKNFNFFYLMFNLHLFSYFTYFFKFFWKKNNIRLNSLKLI